MRIVRQLITLLMVTVVAVLIWAFAEAESLRKEEVSVELIFAPEVSADRQLTLRGPIDSVGNTDIVHLQVRLEGSAASVDEADRILRKPLRFDPYDKSLPATPGEHVLDMRTILASHSEVQRIAASIASVEPATIPATVEELVVRELDVRVELESGETDGQPEPRPAKVLLRTPKAVSESLPRGLIATAHLDAGQLERLVPGRRETVPGVKLLLPEPLNSTKSVRLDPPNIDVHLTLSTRTPTSKALNVPVQVVLASVEQKLWDITFDPRNQFVPDVTVTGPAEIIRQIEERKLPVVALLQLSFTELEGAATQTKEVILTTLPPSPAPLRFDAPSKAVTFTIGRRDPAKR